MRKTLAAISVLIAASILFVNVPLGDANPGVDLIVESISLYPSSPVDGEVVTVYVSVKNQGNETVTTDFWVPIWIDEVYTSATLVTEDLSPGESTAQGVITASWTGSAGDHDFKAEADGGHDYFGWRDDNLVPEDNELNNEKTISIYIDYPDLIVENMFLEPSVASDGETVQIRAIVKNIGLAETKRDFWVPFFVDSTYINAYQVTQNLAPNETTPYPDCPTVSWTLTPGNHEYTVEADGGHDYFGWRDDNLVKESNETNNELTRTLQVGYSDLIIAETHFAPQYPRDGEVITFYATVKNNGVNETTRDFYVPFFVDDSYIGAVLVSSDLSQGENQTVSLVWTATPGNHVVKVEADGGHDYFGWRDDNVVEESNETNNELTRAFYVSQCDYIISDVYWNPANPSVGEIVTIYAKVKNVGSGNSLRDFYVPLFINNTYIGAVLVTHDMAQGEEYTVSYTWTFTAGAHSIKVEADGGHDYFGWRDDNIVTELSEDNNVRIESMSDFDASIVLSASDGYSGMQILINGTGFEPNSHVTILWDALNSSTVTVADGEGNILTPFTIPASYYGVHDLSATDGVDVATGRSFELRRAMVSTPVLYDPGDVDTDGTVVVDCSDATSEIGEVTKYEFQRSLSPVFTSPTTNSRSESRLTLSNLANGTYWFRVRAWDEDNGLYSYWSNTESITVLVLAQVVLTVRVSNNGVPLPDINVTVRFSNNTLVASKLTNQSGYTTFTLVPGTYNVTSAAAGYSIIQTITSDALIVFDPIAKIPEYAITLAVLGFAAITTGLVFYIKKRQKRIL